MHRFIIFSLSIIFTFIALSLAQTDIADKAQVSGVWDSTGSPYRINGEAIVPQGATLIIEAGVRLEFKTGSNHEYVNPAFDMGFLRVQGCLQVQGQADQPVVFTRQGSKGNWGVLFFDENAADSSYLHFATIEHASYIKYLQNWLDYNGALSIVNTPIQIENCRLEHNANDGLFIKQASVIVKNCLIANNGRNGVRALSQSDVQLINSTISFNSSAGFDCGVSSQPHITNCIFWGNQKDFVFGNYSQISITYSMLQSAEPDENVVSGEGNFWNKNPLFIDSGASDYSLAFNSFAVNSGSPDTTGLEMPSTDLNGQPRIAHGRIDIGAFERNASYLRLTRPNGNESFIRQTNENIRWQTDFTSVELQYSTDAGQSWQSMVTVNSQTSFDWLVPSDSSEACYLRVVATDNPSVSDVCDTSFIISDHTIIRDGLSVAGVWNKAMSPIEIRGTAIVPVDSVLHIEPGVRVELHCGTEFNFQNPQFDAGFLWVKGNLSARGAKEDSIVFTVQGPGYWGTLLFDGTDSLLSALKFVKLEKAVGVDSVDGQNFPAALVLNNCGFEIARAKITNNASSGLLLNGESAPTIHNCWVDYNNGSGIAVQNAARFSKPEIFQNQLEYNHRHGILLKDVTAAYVHDNIIEHNDSTGIYLQTGYATPVLENNRLGYQSIGIWCDNAAPKIVGDVVYHANKGIVLQAGSPDMGNVTLARNTVAIDCENASPILTNTLFGYNSQDFTFTAGDNSAPTVSFSMTDHAYFASKVTDAGFNRTNAASKFTNQEPHPFALNKGSAAIDHGTTENSLITLPAFDVAGNPRILDGNHDGNKQIDIGAYEFAELSAGFKAAPVSGAVPLTVQFSDQSVGDIDQWQWNFGDGFSDSTTNPRHTYQRAGKFTVRLAVQGEVGSDTLTRTDYIYTKYPPFVCHPLPDTSFAEDSGWHFLRNVATVFCDSDSASNLTFSLKNQTSQIFTRWQSDSLFVKDDSNFAGHDEIILTAKDVLGLTVSDTFSVTFWQVNDPPFRTKNLPDSLTFTSDSTPHFSLWEYYGDVETPDSLLDFAVQTSNDSVYAKMDSSTGVLSISCDLQFSGLAQLFISVQDDSGAGLQDTIQLKIKTLTAIGNKFSEGVPNHFFMAQNFPNPFNPVTTVKYGLPVVQRVTIDLINVLGRKRQLLRAKYQSAGVHTLRIDAGRLRLSSGIYFVLLRSPKFSAVRKIVLLK